MPDPSLTVGPAPDTRQQSLLVLGSGPKALAIAAKRAVLQRLGYPVPRLVVVDRQGVAAHWSGTFGYTDGRRLLGTLPEKDVGYPYASTVWGSVAANAAVDAAMQAFSWPTYLIAAGAYSDYIDRGRPRPTHAEWSAYLTWVAARADLEPVRGEVYAIETTAETPAPPDMSDATASADGQDRSESVVSVPRWRLRCRAPGGDGFTLEGDGLVLTGPGTPVTIPGQPGNHPRVLDGDTAWRRIVDFSRLRTMLAAPVTIGVVGTGETAAAIVVALLETLGEGAVIEVLTPRGVLYSRDEGFDENRVFSDPDANWISLTGKRTETDQWEWSSFVECHKRAFRWSSLTEADRREFVRRTDRGVFSIQAMSEITRARNVRSVVGTARRLRALPGYVQIEMEYGGVVRHAQYDYVVVARGFDPLWFTSLVDDQTSRRLGAATGHPSEGAIERAIGRDLAVAGLAPRLHLPMLAAVAQGPGFPNLSCLGLLADRVLSSYVPTPQAQRVQAKRVSSRWQSAAPAAIASAGTLPSDGA
jgi:mycobactin lysine-N-oxygenase